MRALQMPSNYVVMDAEEMEYLDGGAPSCKTLANNLKGYGYLLKRQGEHSSLPDIRCLILLG